MASDDAERLRRWRLILGAASAGDGAAALSDRDAAIDRCLASIYETAPAAGKRSGGLGASAPGVARWLGDIRSYFPVSIVRVLQQDAMDRLNLRQMLLEPEMLQNVVPDVRLVADLLALKDLIPSHARESARQVVRRCAKEIEERLAAPLRQAVNGALHRSSVNRRPRVSEINWNRTIRANLKHFQPEYQTIIPETRLGHGRRRSALKQVILCIDQSGSMASSVVYAGILGAVLASLPALVTRVVVFDTAVVDLSDKLSDPVDVLFGTQLGGGTDIQRALSYCQGLVTHPAETVLILISDLIEGGLREKLVKRAASIIASGVTMVTLLALSDDGAPVYDAANAADLTALGSPAFACTPDLFPDLIAAALLKHDIGQWSAQMKAQQANLPS